MEESRGGLAVRSSTTRGRLTRLVARSSEARQAKDDIDPRAILAALDSAVIARDRDGIISAWNQGAERLYGYTGSEILGQPYEVIVPGICQDGETDTVRALLAARASDCYETRRLRKDGAAIAVWVRISPILNAARTVVGVATLEDDVATRATDSMGHMAPYLRSAFEHAAIPIALVDVEPANGGGLLLANPALCTLTGHSRETLQTMDIHALLHPEDLSTDMAAMARLLQGEVQSFQIEERLLHADAHATWVTTTASLVRDSTGNPMYCIRQLQDIEERKRYEGELGYLVEHDALTGLLNRRGFVRELAHQMAYARRYGSGGAVLFLDLDDFKRINDTLGHSTGDEIIAEFADLLSRRLRETDIFARLGGDEFAVLLPDAVVSEAETVSESLLDALREGGSMPLGDGRGVSMSVGITTFEEPSRSLSPEDILIDADLAMYCAKDAGKDRVALASSETKERLRSRVSWAERVRRAAQEGLFELYCQPIVNLASDSVSQWELLLRLPGEGGELILPAKFLYTAERSGLILDIDRWVLTQAIGLIAEQRDAGRAVRLEVNLSGRSVGDMQILALIERELQERKIDPTSLVLELTETAAIANMDRARGFATRLRSLGCGFALDDFGAGFGSFYYLKHIPFNYVKIDGEFIRNLPTSSTDQLILESIVKMSKGLGTATIAEFVGDSETVEVLKAHGVDYAQGYHLGKPLPVAEALAA
jgi:diguanylate cyclase (GGDEF)-like protein/PAS domain S-box-containing protein